MCRVWCTTPTCWCSPAAPAGSTTTGSRPSSPSSSCRDVPWCCPRTNIGRFLEDGVECVLLHEGHALEIAARVEPLLGDPARRERIGAAGRAFARRELRWPKAAAALRELYDEVAGGARRSATPAAGEASAPPAPGDAAAASEAAVGSPEAMEATGPSAASGVSAAPDRAPGEVPCHSRWPVRLIAVTGPPAPPQAGGLEARRYGIEGVASCGAAVMTRRSASRTRSRPPSRTPPARRWAALPSCSSTTPAACPRPSSPAGASCWAARGLPDVHLVCVPAGAGRRRAARRVRRGGGAGAGRPGAGTRAVPARDASRRLGRRASRRRQRRGSVRTRPPSAAPSSGRRPGRPCRRRWSSSTPPAACRASWVRPAPIAAPGGCPPPAAARARCCSGTRSSSQRPGAPGAAACSSTSRVWVCR